MTCRTRLGTDTKATEVNTGGPTFARTVLLVMPSIPLILFAGFCGLIAQMKSCDASYPARLALCLLSRFRVLTCVPSLSWQTIILFHAKNATAERIATRTAAPLCRTAEEPQLHDDTMPIRRRHKLRQPLKISRIVLRQVEFIAPFRPPGLGRAQPRADERSIDG
jgi:hypothetical protein